MSWIECPKCSGLGEVAIGQPGDYLRHDYCSECGGSGSVRLAIKYITATIRVNAESLALFNERIEKAKLAIAAFGGVIGKRVAARIEERMMGQYSLPKTHSEMLSRYLFDLSKKDRIELTHWDREMLKECAEYLVAVNDRGGIDDSLCTWI